MYSTNLWLTVLGYGKLFSHHTSPARKRLSLHPTHSNWWQCNTKMCSNKIIHINFVYFALPSGDLIVKN